MAENEKNLDDNHNNVDLSLTKEDDSLNELLEKEKEKSLRLLADYQNLEKQTSDRINIRGDKIILDFLTVYEDLFVQKTYMKRREET